MLAASPRADGNSRAMADALVAGATEAGHAAEIHDLNDAMRGGFLRDCRTCRLPDGTCAIDDDYAGLLTGPVATADALVYATPLYWYGVAAVLKNFFDRMVCFLAASHPDSAALVEALSGKRSALLLSSEERYATAALGVVAQLQEMSRYLGHELVAVVQGVGNKRREVMYDPADPLTASRRLGRELFELHHSDYRIDSARSNTVWPQARLSAAEGQVGVYDDA